MIRLTSAQAVLATQEFSWPVQKQPGGVGLALKKSRCVADEEVGVEARRGGVAARGSSLVSAPVTLVGVSSAECAGW